MITADLKTAVKAYLFNGRKQFISRPSIAATQRIVGYRTMVCLAYNDAHADGAPAEVLDYLRTEHEWALAAMAGAGITFRTKPRRAPKKTNQMSLFC